MTAHAAARRGIGDEVRFATKQVLAQRMIERAMDASILAEQGRLDEAVSLGEAALEMAGRINSARVRAYLRDVAENLAPHADHVGVQRLLTTFAARGVSTC